MFITGKAILPGGAALTQEQIAQLELDISAELSIRMEAYARQEQQKLEREMLYGTSAMKLPLGLLRSTVRAC